MLIALIAIGAWVGLMLLCLSGLLVLGRLSERSAVSGQLSRRSAP